MEPIGPPLPYKRNIVHSTVRSWFLLHILIPLLPFCLTTLIRAMTCSCLTWKILDTSELALSTGLIMFFTGVSLAQTDSLLADAEEEQNRIDIAMICFVFAIAMIVIFVLIEVFSTLYSSMNVLSVGKPLNTTRIAAWTLFIVSISFVVRVQKSFKLTARMP